MKRSITSLLLSLVLITSSSITLSGCTTSNFQTAQNVYTVANIALNLAQGELPLLVSVGAISQADETALSNFVGLAITFNGNYESCINNAQNTMLTTSSKFVDCLGVFATSLSSPQTLALLHVVSAKGQSKAQAYVAAIVAAVNIGLAAFKAGQVAVPTVAPVTADIQVDINQFQAKVIDNLPVNLRHIAVANGY